MDEEEIEELGLQSQLTLVMEKETFEETADKMSQHQLVGSQLSSNLEYRDGDNEQLLYGKQAFENYREKLERANKLVQIRQMNNEPVDNPLITYLD